MSTRYEVYAIPTAWLVPTPSVCLHTLVDDAEACFEDRKGDSKVVILTRCTYDTSGRRLKDRDEVVRKYLRRERCGWCVVV